ncbi:adenosylcobyric acid synthase (glutamine-hydrolysing) [Saccharopolyspora erythraea NRRL 2338]|uniref:Cobyric acid synthase n=2 Tax=Saccharopolyspora erythraea TaxID=1836 RepID=COBQ_SACEN|nr:cobyric acid synthase [Saccharopolyspora erythraea]A4FM88.1 RecName: Full=Cobyric acid synthase [Saccharopolyspora erythraea NRRL 2338]EQD87754.1 cobyric acid synthase [Saccharopolyspora erythraea D]PFG98800.1 adenosylcobyric acid synthase (glutamine-hydrolysing) [Saccharopolyspora erythraea NRRL 2338]QRK88798.1 cobyric acid synthase [Saccharopolyspora erythraea]CAM05163.1 cobyric acid synthase [Saccharopolyspora erythraea NRRL 2338]
MNALLIAGTTSDAGKSVVAAGVCRWLARTGARVAPFKAQNMSNNSVVTPDGGEIGRAQAVQAAACGLEPSVRFNPVLLKPGSDRRSQVVVLGHVSGEVTAMSYRERKAALLDTVVSTLDGLRAEHDHVICEGAGSPAEINLRATDIANMGLARAAGLPVLVVGDIDRGGVFAQLFGTLALLDAADQALVGGFVINKFRGDPALLDSGLDRLRALTGRPVHGVLPWAEDLWLDAEDSLSYVADGVVGRPAPPRGSQWLRVAVPRLPRISNATDVEALAAEPGVAVRFVTEPSRLTDADLVVLPGSKSTVADLGWLHDTGLADAIRAHAGAGLPVVGICGGFQMLTRRITDQVESGVGAVDGLGMLDLEIEFEEAKTLRRPSGTAFGEPVDGYEIHHGVPVRRGDDLAGLVRLPGGTAEGGLSGSVAGTHWHGLFENDAFRRRFLTWAAGCAGRDGFVAAGDTSFAEVRAGQLDLLGDLVEKHLDTDAIRRLLEGGAPAGLPLLPPGAGGRAALRSGGGSE